MSSADYTRRDVSDALAYCGVRTGDVVFSHSNVGFLGVPDGGMSAQSVLDVVYGGCRDALGPNGTLVVPTFTYSFPKGEPFDPERSASTCGLFTELVRLLPGAERSRDPIFSVAAVGPDGDALTREAPVECFGADSFWGRFLERDGLICNFNFDAGSTFMHYVEKRLSVGYRYDKLFVGEIVDRGETRESASVFFVHDLSNPATAPIFDVFHRVAQEAGIVRTAPVGRGGVVALRARAVFDLFKNTSCSRPWILIEAHNQDAAPDLSPERGGKPVAVAVSAGAGIRRVAESLRGVERWAVSDGAAAMLDALGTLIPLKLSVFPTGARAGGAVIPERWSAGGASIADLDGKIVASSERGDLRAADYSTPVDADVPRAELLRRLRTVPSRAAAIPHATCIFRNRWELALPDSLARGLADDRYRVTIRSRFSYGQMKVAEAVAPGSTEDTALLCAHLGHRGEFNHGLSGVVAGIQVLNQLIEGGVFPWTVRLLIVPAAIGYYAYLERCSETAGRIRCVMFLDMLASDAPYALRLHGDCDTTGARALRAAVEDATSSHWSASSALPMCDDEPVLGAANVPALTSATLSRLPSPGHDVAARPLYHLGDDQPDEAAFRRIDESVETIGRILTALSERCRRVR